MDDLLLQWIVASQDGNESTGASANASTARVQQLDPDNMASWALSLSADGPAREIAMQRIASSTHIDSHTFDIMRLWLDAFEQNQNPQK